MMTGQITKIIKSEMYNSNTGEEIEGRYEYTVVISHVNNPFKKIVEIVSDKVFDKSDMYVGRYVNLSLGQTLRMMLS